jgi:Protein of unknown function (DUF3349)
MRGVGKPVAAAIAFLRCGQPRMAPSTGYSPLLALVARRLTDAEVQLVAAGLVKCHPNRISDIDIAAAILSVTDELPSADDIARVRRVRGA